MSVSPWLSGAFRASHGGVLLVTQCDAKTRMREAAAPPTGHRAPDGWAPCNQVFTHQSFKEQHSSFQIYNWLVSGCVSVCFYLPPYYNRYLVMIVD